MRRPHRTTAVTADGQPPITTGAAGFIRQAWNGLLRGWRDATYLQHRFLGIDGPRPAPRPLEWRRQGESWRLAGHRLPDPADSAGEYRRAS